MSSVEPGWAGSGNPEMTHRQVIPKWIARRELAQPGGDLDGHPRIRGSSSRQTETRADADPVCVQRQDQLCGQEKAAPEPQVDPVGGAHHPAQKQTPSLHGAAGRRIGEEMPQPRSVAPGRATECRHPGGQAEFGRAASRGGPDERGKGSPTARSMDAPLRVEREGRTQPAPPVDGIAQCVQQRHDIGGTLEPVLQIAPPPGPPMRASENGQPRVGAETFENRFDGARHNRDPPIGEERRHGRRDFPVSRIGVAVAKEDRIGCHGRRRRCRRFSTAGKERLEGSTLAGG
jgi:hypothetical protein